MIATVSAGSWISAHGVSSRQDLPLPFGLALTGALVAMAVSFIALGVLWREPRLNGETAGRPLPAGLAEFIDSAEVRWALRIIGLVVTGFVAFAAVIGPDLATNPSAGLVYVVFWVGLVPASLLFGPIWKYLNPLRTIHAALAAALRLDPKDPSFTMPAWLGYWPGAVSLFSFVWLELCAPNRGSTGTLTTYFCIYAGFQLLGSLLFGSDWFARGDGFEVFSTLMGKLSWLGRRNDGVLVRRNPLQNLDTVAQAPGLVAVLGVMLGSTAFDSITSTRWWKKATFDSTLSTTSLATWALLGAVVLVMTLFCVASALAALLAKRPIRGTPTAFAHSLVPISVGYIIAHYFSLFVFGGQQAIIHASDPLVNGSNLFGTAHWALNYGVLAPTPIAVVQVVAIVTGHILGVFAAHDRAVRIFEHRQAIIGQLPMMVLMIGYTFAGLTLLFAG